MAKDKNSFVLYADYIQIFEQLTNDEAGCLIKHLFKYVNDQQPELTDRLLKILFEPIKQQLKRDLKKWEHRREKLSEAGKASANKRQQVSTNVEKSQQSPTVNVNATVNDTVTVNDIVKRERAFAPPTKDDLILVFSEKLDDFTAMGEADKFLNFYESKNWMIGKNKMKNWKSAAAGWVLRMNDFKNKNNGTKNFTTGNKQLGEVQITGLIRQDFAAGRKKDS